MITTAVASATYAGGARASVSFEPYLSLRETGRRIATRALSPVDLTREMLARVAAVDPLPKSYATVMADSAMADAQAAAREIAAGRYRGPLHGDYHRAWGAAQPRSAQFMMPMDLAGVPAICVPCGFSADGLPYSLQFTGRRLSEAMLCRVAFAYEQATEWRRRHPPVAA